jgi:hypothetical protein
MPPTPKKEDLKINIQNIKTKTHRLKGNSDN